MQVRLFCKKERKHLISIQGFVFGAYLLCIFLSHSDSESETESKQRSSSLVNPLRGSWRSALQFWSVAVLLSLVGARVSSLIVLEFCLRAVSTWASARTVSSLYTRTDQLVTHLFNPFSLPIWSTFIHGHVLFWPQDANGRGLDLLLIQCQFSLGCGLTCTLAFLHQGAPHSSLSLLLAAALSWALASVSQGLWSHVARLYPLHSTERYCGKCITILTSGHTILTSLQRAVVLAFALATVASTATVYEHFLSQKDALKFWTPLTLCYTMLVFYIQGDCQMNYLRNETWI